MIPSSAQLEEHIALTRRYFLQCGSAGVAALAALPAFGAGSDLDDAALKKLVDKISYLTPHADFGTVERGNPLPYKLPKKKRLEVGLERETWKLEVFPDPKSNSIVDNPLTLKNGKALDFAGLMKLAKKHATRYLKVITCNNVASPLGMGLWEGVPLKHIIWMAQPHSNVRRVFFWGYHNDKPKQRFQGSLPIGEVLEEQPGTNPVMLAYKLNGEYLSGKRGGPVRMIVPEMYGYKNIKWLQKVVLTNNHQANDTYARGNNDIDSWMKTFARFIHTPDIVKKGQAIPITGLAQVGVSGMKKVQVWVHPQGKDWPEDDKYFTKAKWQDATILKPPKTWGGGLKDGKMPKGVADFDDAGRPKQWPIRYSLAHWAILLKDVPPGKYHIRCRTIDANGVAQPLPRPFKKSGRNAIQRLPFKVV